MSKVKIKYSEQKKLHIKTGNRCPMCNINFVDPKNPNSPNIGENAHIYGENPGSARYDSTKDAIFINSEANLILLCCNCHTKIDSDAKTYTVEYLLNLKASHEEKVLSALKTASVSFTFAELETLCNYIAENRAQAPLYNYLLVGISDKIAKNTLEGVTGYIDMGLTSVIKIEDYFNRHPDPSFVDKITGYMSFKYKELKGNNLNSVDIFYALWGVACGNNTEPNYEAAGLAIVVYFFEKCEVFEK